MNKINKTLKIFNSFGSRVGEGGQNLLLMQKPLVTALLCHICTYLSSLQDCRRWSPKSKIERALS